MLLILLSRGVPSGEFLLLFHNHSPAAWQHSQGQPRIKGEYSSKKIKGASNFFCTISSYFSCWQKRDFLCGFFALETKELFGRAGLMALAIFIASFVCGSDTNKFRTEIGGRHSVDDEDEKSGQYSAAGRKLLGILQLVFEQCRHHFYPSYRLQVCDQVLASAISLVPISEMPLDLLLQFLSSFPREFIYINGSLRENICRWLYEDSMASSCNESPLLMRLCDFPEKFTANNSPYTFVTIDDENLSMWKLEAQRWARMLFLAVTKHNHFKHICSFVRRYNLTIGQEDQCTRWNSTKFILVLISLIEELQIDWKRLTSHTARMGSEMKICNGCILMGKDFHLIGALLEKFLESFQHILEDFVSFARSASAVLWSCNMPEVGDLSGSVLVRLGGPSQLRFPTSSATSAASCISKGNHFHIEVVCSFRGWSGYFSS